MKYSSDGVLQRNCAAKHPKKPQTPKQSIGHLKLSYMLFPFFALFLFASEAWAVSCEAFPRADNNRCRCTSGTSASSIYVGYWYSDGDIGGSGGSWSRNTHLCTDANDSACVTPATAGAIGNLSNGQEIFFANKTVTPIEYFKCTYNSTASPRLTTVAHSPFAVGASVSSIGGLIILAASSLLIGALAFRRKSNQSA